MRLAHFLCGRQARSLNCRAELEIPRRRNDPDRRTSRLAAPPRAVGYVIAALQRRIVRFRPVSTRPRTHPIRLPGRPRFCRARRGTGVWPRRRRTPSSCVLNERYDEARTVASNDTFPPLAPSPSPQLPPSSARHQPSHSPRIVEPRLPPFVGVDCVHTLRTSTIFSAVANRDPRPRSAPLPQHPTTFVPGSPPSLRSASSPSLSLARQESYQSSPPGRPLGPPASCIPPRAYFFTFVAPSGDAPHNLDRPLVLQVGPIPSTPVADGPRPRLLRTTIRLPGIVPTRPCSLPASSSLPRPPPPSPIPPYPLTRAGPSRVRTGPRARQFPLSSLSPCSSLPAPLPFSPYLSALPSLP